MPEATPHRASQNEPRRHHYLPQFYLRGFALDEQLRQVEKPTGRHYPGSVRGFAAIRDYHRLDDSAHERDPNELERALADVENILAPALAEVLRNEVPRPALLS